MGGPNEHRHETKERTWLLRRQEVRRQRLPPRHLYATARAGHLCGLPALREVLLDVRSEASQHGVRVLPATLPRQGAGRGLGGPVVSGPELFEFLGACAAIVAFCGTAWVVGKTAAALFRWINDLI